MEKCRLLRTFLTTCGLAVSLSLPSAPLFADPQASHTIRCVKPCEEKCSDPCGWNWCESAVVLTTAVLGGVAGAFAGTTRDGRRGTRGPMGPPGSTGNTGATAGPGPTGPDFTFPTFPGGEVYFDIHSFPLDPNDVTPCSSTWFAVVTAPDQSAKTSSVDFTSGEDAPYQKETIIFDADAQIGDYTVTIFVREGCPVGNELGYVVYRTNLDNNETRIPLSNLQPLVVNANSQVSGVPNPSTFYPHTLQNLVFTFAPVVAEEVSWAELTSENGNWR